MPSSGAVTVGEIAIAKIEDLQRPASYGATLALGRSSA